MRALGWFIIVGAVGSFWQQFWPSLAREIKHGFDGYTLGLVLGFTFILLLGQRLAYSPQAAR